MALFPVPNVTPYKRKDFGKVLATFDTETDPLKFGRDPKPFTCHFYAPSTGDDMSFWGDDCIEQFFEYLTERTRAGIEYCIYAHNGGNFDFHFCLDYADEEQDPFFIKDRIVKMKLAGQEFRDSYSILPVPLSAYAKEEFDYNLMERDVRQKHKAAILHYQRLDCVYLYQVVHSFLDRFGDRLTMASVALPMLRSFHGFEDMSAKVDDEMRPYFFGGRNQCFETGVLSPRNPEQRFYIYDRNSMYPTVMKEQLHPISGVPTYAKRIGPRTAFARVRAKNYGALCSRTDTGALDFTREDGVFYASVHEIKAGEETGTLKIISIEEAINFEHFASFGDFVDHFYTLRQEADRAGDKDLKLLWKLVLNSSYGKFALDPRKFENCHFSKDGQQPTGPLYGTLREDGSKCEDGWWPSTVRGSSIFWTKPNQRRMSQFLNCATAASITGAARADLLRAIKASVRPIYCDTDSVICERLQGEGISFSETALGGWKTEAEGDVAAIAGKKLYAVFNKGQDVKKASKGVKLTSDQIMEVANGAVVEYANPAPKFQLDGKRQWTTRKIRLTAR